MSLYEDLIRDTAADRAEFLSIPIIQRTLTNGVGREVYLDYLGQAFHHVRHTAPLLALAFARCGEEDAIYRNALSGYLAEEQGHEEWILDDIRVLEGDAEYVRHSVPRLPCKVMVAYAYDLVARVDPYALLGMVHVLEGMSVALATRAAAAIQTSLGAADGSAGFSYLTSHGALDADHVAFFRRLLEELDGVHGPAIIGAARDFHPLYGAIFLDIQARAKAGLHAA
jgi:long-chain acyl-CoA synthetase